mmetsp:Transcript_2429/g.6385  ORF Transcript_2429/g.6385 Transcript_2429/m.6385 type:complete len:118 (-) Transcript_2429:2056-2409(-)
MQLKSVLTHCDRSRAKKADRETAQLRPARGCVLSTPRTLMIIRIQPAHIFPFSHYAAAFLQTFFLQNGPRPFPACAAVPPLPLEGTTTPEEEILQMHPAKPASAEAGAGEAPTGVSI